jgi:hypothetical protein
VSGMMAKAAEGNETSRSAETVALNRLNNTTEKNMAPKDETVAEKSARYERIGKASAKAIKNMLAGTALGGKLRAKGYTWVPEKKDPPKKGG